MHDMEGDTNIKTDVRFSEGGPKAPEMTRERFAKDMMAQFFDEKLIAPERSLEVIQGGLDTNEKARALAPDALDALLGSDEQIRESFQKFANGELPITGLSLDSKRLASMSTFILVLRGAMNHGTSFMGYMNQLYGTDVRPDTPVLTSDGAKVPFIEAIAREVYDKIIANSRAQLRSLSQDVAKTTGKPAPKFGGSTTPGYTPGVSAGSALDSEGAASL